MSLGASECFFKPWSTRTANSGVPKKINDGELKTIYDPACGTGGMLSIGKEFILEDEIIDAFILIGDGIKKGVKSLFSKEQIV